MDLSMLAEIILGAAAILAALAGIGKFFKLGTFRKRTSQFLDDWFGEPPREGYEGRDSFPARMAKVEERTAALNHDMRGEMTSRLTLLDESLQAVDERTKQLQRNGGSSVADAVHTTARAVEHLADMAEQNRAGIGRLEDRANETERRITDHRRRNDAHIIELRKYIDDKLSQQGEWAIRAEAYRASLVELGIEPEAPQHQRPTPPRTLGTGGD